MLLFFQIIFVLVCAFLILVILLQSGKGGDVAAAFGGSGSQTAFGPRGAQKPLEKATVVAALIFMFLALMFSIPGIGTKSVVNEGGAPPPSAPSNPATLPSPTPEASPSPAASASPTASPGPETKASPEAKAAPAASPAKAKASPAASPAKK